MKPKKYYMSISFNLPRNLATFLIRFLVRRILMEFPHKKYPNLFNSKLTGFKTLLKKSKNLYESYRKAFRA